MGQIRSFNALINGGKDDLLDKMLTMAIPESFATLMQTTGLRQPIALAAVAGPVKAELSRQQTGG